MKHHTQTEYMNEGEFNMELQKHLRKCELEYRAKNMPQGSNVPWLAPYCGSVQEIARFLRDLGFKIASIIDEEPFPGGFHRWVVTTSGIIVYANTPKGLSDGLVAGTKNK